MPMPLKLLLLYKAQEFLQYIPNYQINRHTIRVKIKKLTCAELFRPSFYKNYEIGNINFIVFAAIMLINSGAKIRIGNLIQRHIICPVCSSIIYKDPSTEIECCNIYYHRKCLYLDMNIRICEIKKGEISYCVYSFQCKYCNNEKELFCDEY